jgi:hypothetical protein
LGAVVGTNAQVALFHLTQELEVPPGVALESVPAGIGAPDEDPPLAVHKSLSALSVQTRVLPSTLAVFPNFTQRLPSTSPAAIAGESAPKIMQKAAVRLSKRKLNFLIVKIPLSSDCKNYSRMRVKSSV